MVNLNQSIKHSISMLELNSLYLAKSGILHYSISWRLNQRKSEVKPELVKIKEILLKT